MEVNILRYLNLSVVTKTYYGVTFAPGETKEVPGYINDKAFIRVDNKSSQKRSNRPAQKVDLKPVQPSPKANTEKPNKEESKNG